MLAPSWTTHCLSGQRAYRSDGCIQVQVKEGGRGERAQALRPYVSFQMQSSPLHHLHLPFQIMPDYVRQSVNQLLK